MTPFTKSFISKSILIGHFDITKTGMTFDTPYRNSRGKINKNFFINDLGPVVYIMVCAITKELIKIGKAAGIGGFYGRMGTYNRGYLGDETNIKIINYMNSINQNIVLVYAIKAPNKLIEIEDTIENCYFNSYTETASDLERRWTKRAKASGEPLNGSYQK